MIEDNTYIYSSDTIYSKPVALTKVGKLLIVKKCKDEWCKIFSKETKGWIKKTSLWGLL